MTTITLPTLHLNGDSAKTLLEDNRRAMEAVLHATNELAKAAPNGRNFYPQGPDAIDFAKGEHANRLNRLQSVYDELMAICMHINENDQKR